MRNSFIIGLITLFCYMSNAQNNEIKEKIYSMSDFVTIKIQDGYTIHGTRSITLQREGLIYWYDPFNIWNNPSLEGLEEEAKFISFTELDIKKVFEIIKYVHEEKLYDIKELKVPPGTVLPSGRPVVLTFIVHDQFLYTGFNYMVCDTRIDRFIQMMNDLIPEKDRDKFGIKLRCDYKQ